MQIRDKEKTQQQDYKKGDLVSFYEIKNGKTIGLQEEVFEVNSFVDMNDDDEWEYMEVISKEDGRSIWTNRESVEKVEKYEKKEKYEQMSFDI